MHTEHLNLTYKQFSTDCVMRWRQILEEYYGVALTYIKGTTNIVADALSSHLEDFSCVPDNDLAKLFLNKRANDARINPLNLVLIDKEEQKDTALLRKL